jgi:hypothetical protein
MSNTNHQFILRLGPAFAPGYQWAASVRPHGDVSRIEYGRGQSPKEAIDHAVGDLLAHMDLIPTPPDDACAPGCEACAEEDDPDSTLNRPPERPCKHCGRPTRNAWCSVGCMHAEDGPPDPEDM